LLCDRWKQNEKCEEVFPKNTGLSASGSN